MANLSGTNVASTVVPFTDQDTYATGNANYIKGGRHSVPTLTDRNAIYKDRRVIGMHCYVAADGKTYELINNPTTIGTTSSDWKESGGDSDETYVFVNDRVVVGANKLEFFYDKTGQITSIKANLPSEVVLTQNVVMAIDCLSGAEWKEVGVVTIPAGQTRGQTLLNPTFSIDNQYVRQRIVSCENSLTNLVVKVTIL